MSDEEASSRLDTNNPIQVLKDTVIDFHFFGTKFFFPVRGSWSETKLNRNNSLFSALFATSCPLPTAKQVYINDTSHRVVSF